MASPSDLTSLASVKSWLGVTLTTDDAMLTRLITAASRYILNYIGRPSLLPAIYTDSYDGVGQRAILLRQWPVIAVNSLSIDGNAIQAATSLNPFGPWSPGYVLDPSDVEPAGSMQKISLRGTGFWCGRQNISVSYVAGYQVTGEAAAVPSVGPYTVQALAPFGDWGSDRGVTYAAGGAITAVQGAPAQGQYQVASGIYTFCAADAGQAVALSYGYVPADLAEACMEIVAERYRYRDRIGMASKSLGGQETVTYSLKGMSDYVQGIINGYRHVVPC